MEEPGGQAHEERTQDPNTVPDRVAQNVTGDVECRARIKCIHTLLLHDGIGIASLNGING
ncbi:hypothetical protein KSF_087880 [Reticulibacter mediterranei]|uniref:Uncharacterized protein n=1 Tax=Reticulibacter mediterranei TaxID=2778369 RepID=A0A8J3N7Q9_9CHLR|nr:hypothetical protein KSF_087880 [Reticulibacter mediterranei]